MWLWSRYLPYCKKRKYIRMGIMKNVLITYFSQGGTTEKTAKHIARGLTNENCKVDLSNLIDKNNIDIHSYDAIGIGFPVYIYRIPFIVTDFIKSLPDLNGKPFFIFILYGTIPGNAGTEARKMLSRKGGKEIGYSKYKGKDYFLGFLQKGYLFSPDNPSNKELETAVALGQNLAENINTLDYIPSSFESGPGSLYTLQKLMTLRPFGKYFYRFFYNVDKKKCTRCNICVTKCPVDNITTSSKGYPKFGSKCISCWYCELSCPSGAITSPLDWIVMKPLLHYDVKQALKDPSIEKASIKIENGKIVRL
jgi:flavodoxin/ferredoxin